MKYITFIILLLSVNLLSQKTGIKNKNPTSTLDLQQPGALTHKYEEITTNKLLTIQDFFVNYNPSSNPSTTNTVTLPVANNITGRIYTVKNSSSVGLNVTGGSNTIRSGNSNGVAVYNIPAGQTFKFYRNSNNTTDAWDAIRIHNPIISTKFIALYSTQLKIPKYSVLPTQYSTYNQNNWKLISANRVGQRGDRIRGENQPSSGGRETIGFRAASLELEYEYQGLAFDVSKMHPILSCGNNASNGISLIPSFAKLTNENVIENNIAYIRTRLKIVVTRVDRFGISTSNGSTNAGDYNVEYISEWDNENAFLNILLTSQVI